MREAETAIEIVSVDAGRKLAGTAKPDGSLVEIGIGPTDRRQESRGTWKLEDDNSLLFYGKAGTKPKRMKIVSLDKERLVVKR